MAEKKIIDVEVRESGIDELNKKLEKTEQNLKDVDRQADKTEESIKDVGQNGGAIATLDELTGGLATKFKNAAEAAKLFGTTTRAALLATGIGALVVALGTIVAYWDDIVDFVEGTNKRLERQNDLLRQQQKIIESEQSLIDAQIELAEAQGKSADELLEKKKDLLRAEIGINGALLTTLNLQREQLRLEIARDNARRMAANIGISNATFGLINNAFSLADQGPLNELNNTIIEIQTNIAKTQAALQALINGNGPNGEETRPRAQGVPFAETPGVITGLTLTDLSTFIDIEAGLIREAQKANTDVSRQAANARLAIAEAEAQGRIEALYSVAQATMAFADLIGQTTAAGKAFATAAAITNTWAGVSEVLSTKSTLPEPFATIARIANIATVVATGLDAVRRINSVQVPNANINSSYFGSASVGASAPAVATPSFNIIGDSGQNQLIDTIRGLEDRPLRAYVVQDDVRSAGELDRRIRASASIG